MIPFSRTMRSTSGIVNVTGSNFMVRGLPSVDVSSALNASGAKSTAAKRMTTVWSFSRSRFTAWFLSLRPPA